MRAAGARRDDRYMTGRHRNEQPSVAPHGSGDAELLPLPAFRLPECRSAGLAPRSLTCSLPLHRLSLQPNPAASLYRCDILTPGTERCGASLTSSSKMSKAAGTFASGMLFASHRS